MLESQKRLLRDGLTDGGSKIELIGWTETDQNTLEKYSVHQIDVDDEIVWAGRTPLGIDPNGWTACQLFSNFSLIF